MRSPRSIQRSLALALVLAMTTSLPCRSEAQTTDTAAIADASALQHRVTTFLGAVRRKNADSIAVFFPRSGDWTYVHTAHHEDGPREGVRRFSGSDALFVISRRGPLGQSFTINYQEQPIGLFAHQVMHRGTGWRRVRDNRFVPPGASASSAIFVEWRREGDRWVVSAFGDETFPSGKTPPWCC